MSKPLFSKSLIAAVCLLLSLACSTAIADLIPQSAAYSRQVLMTSTADHITGSTGLTLVITESKAGSAFASISPTVTELGNGWYSIALTAAMTSTEGALNLHVSASGADPTDTNDQVQKPSSAVASGIAQAGASTTITLSAGSSATTDLYKGNVIVVAGGTGAGQARTITAYNGGTLVATVSRAWTVNPDSTSVYVLVANPHAALDANLAVTAGTVSDKTGYTASTVSDKTGYSLATSQTFNTTGSVGSVTGSVGSVTATVPANVTQVAGQTASAAAGVTFPASIASASVQPSWYSDPWTTLLPGAYGAGTAGFELGHAMQAGNVTVGGYGGGQDPATLVLDVAAAGHNTAGTIGAKINSAASAGDPLASTVPGSYASGSAGYLIGHSQQSGAAVTLPTGTGSGQIALSGGNVTVGGYAAGQDPFTLLEAGSTITFDATHTSNGSTLTLSWHQLHDGLLPALLGGDATTTTAPTRSGTGVQAFYLPGHAKGSGTLVATQTVTYDANLIVASRGPLVVQNPFPSF